MLAHFSDVTNDRHLLIGWLDYANSIGSQPIEAQIFSFWYLAKHAGESLAWSPHYHQFFDNIDTTTRSAQKQGLRDTIALVKQMPNTAADPGIDPRPLVLPA